MAATPSNMLPLGTQATSFNLFNPITNSNLSLEELKGKKGTMIVFMCNHCPYVIHVIEKLVALYKDYQSEGITFIGISANDVEHYPQDSPDKMKEFAQQYQLEFPYLYDESQETARAYKAACTPDFYLFDAHLELVYRGQFDDSRPGNDKEVTGKDLKSAIDHLLKGKTPLEKQLPSIGCNIKWKN